VTAHTTGRRTVTILALAGLSFAMVQTMVAPALPAIQRQLGASTEAATWLLTVNLVSTAAAAPVLSRLGDIRGRKGVLLIVMTVFGAGTVVCALSTSLGVMIAGRAIQGVGGAIFPLSFGVIREELPRHRVAQGIGMMSATFGVGGVMGVLLAGPVVDRLGYPWIFWIVLPLIVVSVIAVRRYVPDTPPRHHARLDLGGAALLTSGLTLTLVAIGEGNDLGWDSPLVLLGFAAGTVLFTSFAFHELRTADPIVDMRTMQRRAVWTTNATGVAVGFGMFGSLLLIPQLVQASNPGGFGFGATVTETDLFVLPIALGMLVGGPLAGQVGVRLGNRFPLLIGIGCSAAGYASLSIWHDQRLHVLTAAFLMGLGLGLSWAAMASLIVEAVDPDQTSVAASMNAIARTCGGALSGQVAGSILGATAVAGAVSEFGFVVATLVCCGALIVALALALLIPGKKGLAAQGGRLVSVEQSQ